MTSWVVIYLPPNIPLPTLPMHNTDPDGAVFFSDVNRTLPAKPLSVKWLWPRVIRFFCGAYTHATIGYLPKDELLSPSSKGSRLWSLAAYADRYPSIVCGFAVPFREDPHLSELEVPEFNWVASFLRYWSWGWIDPVDCVGVATAILRSQGCDIATRVRSPKHLHQILISKGYHHVKWQED